MGQKISGIDYYLPKKIITNKYMVETFGFENSFIEEKLGIVERRHADIGESCHDLAYKAAIKLFNNQDIYPKSIDLLVVVTQNPDYRLPNVAPLLQKSLCLKDNIAGLDINLGCSGFIYALAVVKGLMATCTLKRALIVTSDPYSKIMSDKDRATFPLFGDGAAAVLLDACEEERIGCFDFGTDGTGAETLIVRGGGSKYPNPACNETDNFLFMDGRSIYTFMMRRVPQSIKTCLSLNKLDLGDIDYFVFHQASKYMLNSLMNRIKIPPEKMIIDLKFCGNTVSSSIPIALRKLLSDKKNVGKLALLSGFGVGLSWGSVIVKL